MFIYSHLKPLLLYIFSIGTCLHTIFFIWNVEMCLLYCLQDLKALGSSYLTLKNYFELIFADCICMILESGLGSFFHSFFTTETQVICCLRILLSFLCACFILHFVSTIYFLLLNRNFNRVTISFFNYLLVHSGKNCFRFLSHCLINFL